MQPHAPAARVPRRARDRSTAAEFCADPAAYDESTAWERSIEAVGATHREQLRPIARACAYGPLAAPEETPVHHLVDDLETALQDPTCDGRAETLRAEMQALRDARSVWTDDANTELRDEIAPWLLQGEREADAALAALRLVRRLRDGASDAEALMHHCFALLFAWSAARDGSVIVLGPRFAIHPAVVQRSDGTPAVDVELAVHEDCSAVDRLCRIALGEYQRWVDATKDGV